MKLTDERVFQLLSEADNAYLYMHIDSLSSGDLDEDMTDAEIALDEAEYLLSMYSEDETVYWSDLKWAKSLLRKTDNGKRIPISTETFKPLEGYTPADIQEARDVIASVDRLKTIVRKLRRLA